MKTYRAQAEWYLKPLGNRLSVSFPKTHQEANQESKNADVIFFWQKEAFWAAPANLRRKGIIVDEYAQQAVGDRLDRFVADIIAPDLNISSEAFFKAVKKRNPDVTSVMIIGSGPAHNEGPKDNKDSRISIYLSTAILNLDMSADYPPDIIIAVDGPSQFGPSKTAQVYRARAADLARKHGSLILIPAQHLPSAHTHWPDDIQSHIFAVPLTRQVQGAHRLIDNWHYEPTSNVLTSFGLPCAASLSDEIYFLGISLTPDLGNKRSHWEHENEALYQRYAAPMFAVHPASGQDDTGYLQRHHARLNLDLAAYAAVGKTFTELGGSQIQIDPKVPPAKIPQKLPIRVRFFEAIAKVEHYPMLIICSVFILAGLLGTLLQYSIGLDMLGFLITGGVAAFLIAGVLFLRIRMNRMTARLETKLSQQQAQQFSNLSERLEAVENKIERKK